MKSFFIGMFVMVALIILIVILKHIIGFEATVITTLSLALSRIMCHEIMDDDIKKDKK